MNPTAVRRFSGKVALVTGASRGIGQAVAVALAGEDALVVGVARSNQEETARRAREAGGAFEAIACDLGRASAGDLQKLVDRLLERHGRIDVLVNNAGMIRRSPALEVVGQDWDEVLRVNLTGPFFLAQAVAKWWCRGGRARAEATSRLKIVNIASLLSFQGGILVPAYAASKHGLLGVTRALANEWASQRINVNAVAPGYIATENTAALRADPSRSRSILERIPEGKWGTPQEIAGACLFLASKDADYINGAVVSVDGGWLAR